MIGPQDIERIAASFWGSLMSTTTSMHVPTGLVPAIVVIAVLFGLERFARFLFGLGRDERDPVRLYTPVQRREATRRAGGRCEHKALLWRRCGVRVGLQGDHVYPWSKGGATIESNLQMLCGPHNRRKSNAVPSWLTIKRLERRRRRYFPSGADVRVRWRR